MSESLSPRIHHGVNLGLANLLSVPALPSAPDWLCEQCLQPSTDLMLLEGCVTRGGFSQLSPIDPGPGHSPVSNWICFRCAEDADLIRHRADEVDPAPLPTKSEIRRFKQERHEAVWIRHHIGAILGGSVRIPRSFRFFKMNPKEGDA